MDNKGALPRVGANPLPRSKLVFKQIIQRPSGVAEYQPAPLDRASMWNGQLKYDHPLIALVTPGECRWITFCLHKIIGPVLGIPMWDKQRAFDELEDDKAAGAPFNWDFGPSKGDVKKHLCFEQLLAHFCTFDQYSLATLKDELRVVGKDARLFIPTNIAMIAVGNWLFGAQNEQIVAHHNSLPIKVGLKCPAFDMSLFWRRFLLFGGEYHALDGAENDAHFSALWAILIRDFRKIYLPKEFHKLVDRYYDMVYNGNVSFGGYCYHIYGQKSGHTNTAIDNSLCSLCGLLLHACRSGLGLDEFLQQVMVGIVGDDLLIADRTEQHCYRPQLLEETWHSFGMYLESMAQVEDFFDLVFMGVTPMLRQIQNRNYLLYIGRTDKLLNSLNYFKIGRNAPQCSDKLVSICAMLFADQVLFDEVRDLVRRQCFEMKQVDKIYLLEDKTLLNLFTGLQSVPKTGVIFCPGALESNRGGENQSNSNGNIGKSWWLGKAGSNCFQRPV